MATVGPGPGPGTRPGFRKSWAQMVGGNLPSSWNKNILEILLEKDDKGPFNVSDTDCSHLLSKLGVDPKPGGLVEAIQICPTGRGVILITFKQGVVLDNFCRYDVIEVTRTGVRAVHVKPAGKRDVVVTLKGLHPNTRDDGVINYLSKYGKLVSNKVVYGTFGEGPLKGVRNGDRSFKMEIKADTNIGTYHAVDGQRVTLRYKGQLQTCARCFETAVTCKGGGIARKCEAAQGAKVEFSDFILKLWQEIGYSPGEIEMAAIYDELNTYDASTDPAAQKVGIFTPEKQVTEPEKFSGLSIKQFPKEADHGEIMEFLVKAGLPETLKETVVIRNNGLVTIKGLSNSVCLDMISRIHNKVEFGKKLFCNGLIALTPEKEDVIEPGDAVTVPSQPLPVSKSPTGSKPALDAMEPSKENVTLTQSPLKSSLPSLTASDFSSASALVRRYSWSLSERPPACSIAADILNTKVNLLSEIKDLNEKLSEFESCVSSDYSDDEVANTKNKSRPKRKASKTPIKSDEKVKKPAISSDWYDEANDEVNN